MKRSLIILVSIISIAVTCFSLVVTGKADSLSLITKISVEALTKSEDKKKDKDKSYTAKTYTKECSEARYAPNPFTGKIDCFRYV